MRGGSCGSLNASNLPRKGEWLLLRVDRTFQPTRSGTGSVSRRHHPHALGQAVPRSRTLVQAFHHGLQARFRTFPVVLGDGRDVGLQIEKGQQEGRVEIALHGSNPTCAPMPALRQRLLHVAVTPVTILTELAVRRTHVGQGAAGGCNQAFETCYKAPWSTVSDTLAKAFLPSFEGSLLNPDGGAQREDFVGEVSVQALTVGREATVLVGLLTPAPLIPPTFVPVVTTLPDPTFF